MCSSDLNQFTKDKLASTYAQFFAWHEGIEGIENDDQDNSIAQFVQGTEKDKASEENEDNGQFYSHFLTNTVHADAYKMTTMLANRAVRHELTKEDPFEEQKAEPHTVNFMPKNRYLTTTFHGIMPDSGAAGVLTAGHPQFRADPYPASIIKMVYRPG